MVGFFNVLKSTGLTSSDVVVKVRRLINFKTVGHMGTLDPFGAGVLPIAVGQATRLFDFLQTKEKKYRATFCFGYESDTLDSMGKVQRTGAHVPSINQIQTILPLLCGKINQIPPLYSAKKVNGAKAYDLARNGQIFALAAKEVNIQSIELVAQFSETSFTFDITCSGGTYIRSLCRDMASLLNTSAIMTNIIRLKSGDFDIVNSLTLEELAQNPSNSLISIQQILSKAPKIDFDGSLYKQISNGVQIELDSNIMGEFVVCCNGEIFGLGKNNDGKLNIKTWLHM